MDSTFDNNISGDGVLTIEEQYTWIKRNFRLFFDDGIVPANLWNLRPRDVPYPGDVCDRLMTPARVMSNLMWLNLPVGMLRQELGEFNVLDIGCGSGRYFSILDKIMGGLHSYLGVDVKRHRNFHQVENDPRVTRMISPAEEVADEVIRAHNIIISQSALEHIPEELKVLRHVADALRNNPTPTVQIHIVPAPLQIRQWGPHGFRTFNGRSVQTIFDLFKDFSECCVYTLGGPECSEVHFSYIFDVLDESKAGRFKHERRAYVDAVKAAIEHDTAAEQVKISEACFLALVIHSHPRSSIFTKDTFS